MKWIETKIITTPMAVDAISEILFQLGAKGISVIDPNDMENFKEEFPFWDYIDERAEISKKDEAIISVYFPKKEVNYEEKIAKLKNRMEELPSFGLEIGRAEISSSEMEQEDWEEGWKQYFKTFHATEKMVIHPIWEEYVAKDGEVVIDMDPGMAFGTGEHETTAMCIQLLEETLREKDDVLDIGCGSGILSIAGKKLGAAKVEAIDLDPVAVRVAKENIAYNRLSDEIIVKEGNLTEKVSGTYDIVVANIMADVILILLDTVSDYMKKDGIFIASGIINEKMEEILRAMEQRGFSVVKTLRKGEWNALVAKRGE